MKKYEKPTASAVNVTSTEIIATSGLKYTNESADKNHQVLTNKHRGDWGNVWQ